MSFLRDVQTMFTRDALGGVLLIVSTLAALVLANSSAAPMYQGMLNAPLSISIGDNGLTKPLLLWINDGLMAVFFLLVGLELKAELLEGKLSNPRNVILPGMAALGGLAAPALIFFALNAGQTSAQGWAIPAATDIAFALGILALVSPNIPSSLKVFLLTLAILDDLAAIVIIALFYTENLNTFYLMLALAPTAILIVLNAFGIHKTGPFLWLGVILWVLVLKSGVHATLAGIVTAFAIPLKDRWGKSPLHALEGRLSSYVLYVIVPIFAFANAGVVLGTLSPSDVLAPVTLGIALGLIVGKQLGVFGAAWLTVKLGAAQKPNDMSWGQLYGLACLAGIGFTMSLFIGGLTFDDAVLMNQTRLGVLTGSLISGLMGFVLLRRSFAAKT